MLSVVPLFGGSTYVAAGLSTSQLNVYVGDTFTVSLSGDYTIADGMTTDLSDSLIVTVEEKPEDRPDSGEEPTDNVPDSGTTENTPDTGANYNQSGFDANGSGYFATFAIVSIILLLGLVIRRLNRRA